MSTKLTPGMHIHIVGIGGTGMSAIARVLLGRGFQVSGSDRQSNEQTAALEAAGVTIYLGHAAGHIDGADLVVVSSAVPTTNPERSAALAQGLPVLKRADLLGELMTGSIGIAVAGSHGKTTTTSLVANILAKGGEDPTFVIDERLKSADTNARLGASQYLVAEA
ncbi:MAG TPA: Mur ligase domain-containing protein, partial [Promineifilum sp.]|nr:Mur ligase domain-containing protein [Promineifilum sp.]